MNSLISEMPGPAVEVMERAPAQPAPSTIPAAASSSSACTTAYVALPVSLSMRKRLRYPISDSTSDDDGVIGYHSTTVTPANMHPSAAAALPSMMILPAVWFIRSTRYGSVLGRFLAAKS